MEFLLSQQEYKGINWEYVQNNYDKIWDLFIGHYPAGEAHIERFSKGAKIEEVITKDRTTAKVQNIRTDFKKTVKESGGGRVAFAFYSLCQGLWASSLVVTEAVVQRCSVKKLFLEISQNSQENTCAGVSFLTKL